MDASACRGGLDWWWWCGWGEHGQRFDHIEAGTAEKLVDDGLGEAGGVVFDADGLLRLVEVELADAVDLAQVGDRERCRFRWRHSIAVQNIKLGHGLMIAAVGHALEPVD